MRPADWLELVLWAAVLYVVTRQPGQPPARTYRV